MGCFLELSYRVCSGYRRALLLPGHEYVSRGSLESGIFMRTYRLSPCFSRFVRIFQSNEVAVRYLDVVQHAAVSRQYPRATRLLLIHRQSKFRIQKWYSTKTLPRQNATDTTADPAGRACISVPRRDILDTVCPCFVHSTRHRRNRDKSPICTPCRHNFPSIC